MKNIFTIDTEDWFHANYEDDLFRNDAAVKSTVEENTEVYLEALERNHATATFFVLGFVAEQHPGLVQKIAQAGHEVASHGYGHQLVYKQTPEEFRQDILRSKKLLEDIIGKPVRGYRAPSWSITEESLWALTILEEEGFAYDSSIFPFKNFLYGISGAPRFPFAAAKYQPRAEKLLEIPPSPGAALPVYPSVCKAGEPGRTSGGVLSASAGDRSPAAQTETQQAGRADPLLWDRGMPPEDGAYAAGFFLPVYCCLYA